MTTAESGEQRCWDCRETKPLAEFYRCRPRPNGRQPRCRQCSKEHYEAHHREYMLKRKFGITSQEYDDLLAEQGGVCVICKTPPGPGKDRLAVDHDHGTGAIRGLLCHACNRAIGWLKDDVHLVHRAALYLARGGKPDR